MGFDVAIAALRRCEVLSDQTGRKDEKVSEEEAKATDGLRKMCEGVFLFRERRG